MRAAAVARLHASTRGAMLVVGVVMALLLVGALYHIVSVGDAILWRERMQDGADAAAFEASVWQARGMNVIVFLNILMAAAMAVLVALRGIIILSWIVLGVFTTACAFAWVPVGITQALCTLSASVTPTVVSISSWAMRAEQRAAPQVLRLVRRLRNAQQVVATVTPILSAKEAAVRTRAAYQHPALAVGASMLLPSIHRRGASARLGYGLSLPVSEDDAWKLCEKAGAFVPNELLALLNEGGLSSDVLDQAGGAMRSLLGTVTGSLPEVFCGDRSPSDVAGLQDTIRQTAEDGCRAAEKEGPPPDTHPPERSAPFRDYWRGGTTFDFEACRRGRIDAQNRRATQDRLRTNDYVSARVWRYAQNGDVFMQNWGFSFRGDGPRHLAADDRGLTFVTRFDRSDLQPAEVPSFAFAQSELYFDCANAWGHEACGDSAMWKMAWKARLRRAHSPLVLAQRSVEQIAQAELIFAMDEHLKRLAGRLDDALGNAVGSGLGGGRLDLLASVLRGNLWSTSLLNDDEVLRSWELLPDTARSLSEQLRANPPAPGEQYIH